MQNSILQKAPQEFGYQFLEWIRHLEDQLLVKFADWFPSPTEEVQRYAESVRQSPPKELLLYYEYAYPFGLLRSGWNEWYVRNEKYRVAWIRFLVGTMGLDPVQAESVVHNSPPLWPIYCLEKQQDIVGFNWKDEEIAVIEVSLAKGGGGKPLAVGLRNYFLVNVTLELLAEDGTSVDFDKLRHHPKVLEVSGWPAQPPFPEHVALIIDGSQGAIPRSHARRGNSNGRPRLGP